MTKDEKEKAIEEFQEAIRGSLCDAFEKFHKMLYMVFFLSDTNERVSLRRITEEEWQDKNWLRNWIGVYAMTAWRRTHTGTHKGDYIGFLPTGKKITWQTMIFS